MATTNTQTETTNNNQAGITRELPANQPSRAAELIAKARARHATMAAGTVSSRVVESTGPLTVKDVKITQPRAVDGYRVQVASGLEPDTPIGALNQDDYRAATVRAAVQGDGTRAVIQADEDHDASVSRNLLDSSDEDAVLDGYELAQQLTTELDEADVQKALGVRQGKRRVRKGA